MSEHPLYKNPKKHQHFLYFFSNPYTIFPTHFSPPLYARVFLAFLVSVATKSREIKWAKRGDTKLAHHIPHHIAHDLPTTSPPYRPRHHPPTRTLLLFPFGKGMPTISPTTSSRHHPPTRPLLLFPSAFPKAPKTLHPFVPFWKRDKKLKHNPPHNLHTISHTYLSSFCSLLEKRI